MAGFKGRRLRQPYRADSQAPVQAERPRPPEEMEGGDTAGEIIRSGEALVRMQQKYVGLVQIMRPRDEERIRDLCIADAKKMADLSFWAISFKNHAADCADRRSCNCPSDGTSGASVKLTRAIARRWGNLVSEPEIVADTEDHWDIKNTVLDMETVFVRSDIYRQPKLIPMKGGGWIKPDAQRARQLFATGVAFAERNSTLKVLPADLVDEVVQTARSRTREVFGLDKAKAIERMLKAFVTLGVEVKTIHAYLEKDPNKMTVSEFENLLEIGANIREGHITPQQAFGLKPMAMEPPSAKGAPSAAQAVKRAPEAEANASETPKQAPPQGQTPVPTGRSAEEIQASILEDMKEVARLLAEPWAVDILKDVGGIPMFSPDERLAEMTGMQSPFPVTAITTKEQSSGLRAWLTQKKLKGRQGGLL